jgi:SAM-dependent methyltransferase
MGLTDWVHENCVVGRRMRKLCDHLGRLTPHGSSVLDVGCGDGSIARLLMERRRDLRIKGIDVLIRRDAQIPVDSFNGKAIPFEDASFDVVMFVDVLHHTGEPMMLLSEAARVARRAIVIKDHLADGMLAVPTLRFMDRVGNARHGVALPYNYWSHKRWLDAFKRLGLSVGDWASQLEIYPWPLDWLFGRSLHFAACLNKT